MLDERKLQADAEKHGAILWFRGIVACPKHKNAKPAFSCAHTLSEEEKRIALMPERYFVCHRCLLAMPTRWKLWRDGVIKCRACVWERIEALQKIDPTAFTDFRKEPDEKAEGDFLAKFGADARGDVESSLRPTQGGFIRPIS